MLAAVYARYSSDNQNGVSTPDRVRVCKRRIEREVWTVRAVAVRSRLDCPALCSHVGRDCRHEQGQDAAPRVLHLEGAATELGLYERVLRALPEVGT